MRHALLPLVGIAVLAALGLAARDDPSVPAAVVKLVEIGRFDQAVHVTSPPGDERLFVVERTGRVRVLDQAGRGKQLFLDLSHLVSQGPEEGLLSLAFAPDYAATGRLYVDYTDARHRTIVAEYRRSDDPSRADPVSARRVLEIENPTDLHHGGLLVFGPDGHLYVGQGDGGILEDPRLPAQRLDDLHGKILRIDPLPARGRAYAVPPDNPFVGRAGRDEIWAYGLRNPWRFGFDDTGALVIGDVGHKRAEEIDVAPRSGLNFGWNCLEGTEPYHPLGLSPVCEGAVAPALELRRYTTAEVEPPGRTPTVTRGRPPVRVLFTAAAPGCGIVVGGALHDGVIPVLDGRFLYGDFCHPPLRSFAIRNGRVVDEQPLGVEVPFLSSFGSDGAGRVYATSLFGSVYRLEAR